MTQTIRRANVVLLSLLFLAACTEVTDPIIDPGPDPSGNINIVLTGDVNEDSDNIYIGEVEVTLTTDHDDISNLQYALNDGGLQSYEGPFSISDEGTYTLRASATDAGGRTINATPQTFTVAPTTDPGPGPDPDPEPSALQLRNTDATRNASDEVIPGFYEDRLVLHRIRDTSEYFAGRDWSGLEVHDSTTLQLVNPGDDALEITALTLSNLNAFTLPDAPTLPLSLAAGESYDLEIQFIEEGVRQGPQLIEETLSITPSAGDPLEVALVGIYMQRPEGQFEVRIQQLADAFFGAGIDVGAPLLHNDPEPQGEEVWSAFWQKLEPDEPIYVRQLAAFHACCGTGNQFQDPFAITGNGGGFRHHGLYSQTIFPPLAGSDEPAELVDSNPETEQFEIRSANYSSNTAHPQNNNNLGVRFWPVKDRDSGQVLSGSYLVLQDYVGQGCGQDLGNNCDYNDNVYLITNIAPAADDDGPSVQDSYRLNVAGGSYTDASGNTWQPDSGFFSPSSAQDEGREGLEIANTDDDELYWSYRAFLGNSTMPISERVLSYELPVNNGSYDVTLHFAEIYWGAPGTNGSAGGVGSRVFDVTIEGNVVLTDFDITQEAGAALTAVTREFEVVVEDGVLDLRFIAKEDFGAISAIEVLPSTP